MFSLERERLEATQQRISDIASELQEKSSTLQNLENLPQEIDRFAQRFSPPPGLEEWRRKESVAGRSNATYERWLQEEVPEQTESLRSDMEKLKREQVKLQRQLPPEEEK